MVTDGSKLFLFGGFHTSLQTFLGDFYSFDLSTNIWTNHPIFRPSERSTHSWVPISSNLFLLFGGLDDIGSKSDYWVFDSTSIFFNEKNTNYQF
jgi:hypothetical protein